MKLGLLGWLFWVAVIGSPVWGAEEPLVSAPSELVELLAKRLELGREVAWAKYQKGLPVLAPAREEQLLMRMAARARELNLDTELVRRCFDAQMAASRLLQEECIAHWKTTGSLPESPPLDLVQDIRPMLDILGESILQNLDSANLASLTAPEARQYFKKQGFSLKVTELALGFENSDDLPHEAE